jgi:hypothetical protein
MYVTDDSITTKFETMTNKELGAFIRAELKKVGITSRMVSTRVSYCGYSTAVDCYIKDLSVDFDTVRKIVEQVEYIRYDEYAQEILSGCNIFAHVQYDWEIMRDARNAIREEVTAEMEKLNDNCSHKLYVAEDGNEVWMIPCKHEDGEGHIWYTYHVGKVNSACDRQFNSWESFVGYMIDYKAIEKAKNSKKVA